MTVHVLCQPADTYPDGTPTDDQRHRWILPVLAQLIGYSEKHGLATVSDPLIEAMEQIAPALAEADAKGVDQRATNNVIAHPARNVRFKGFEES